MDFINELKQGNRTYLSKAITLSESSSPTDNQKKIKLFDEIIKSTSTSKSKRIGITGVPGSGKSTLIDKLVQKLVSIDKSKKIAIIAIDPSSAATSGSILGDKIRMENIISYDNVFIRPVPSSKQIDGVSAHINETILLCEYAGYDYIIVETVGVGQAAIGISNVVDCVLNVQAAGTGDEVQGIKKGILETVDIVAINKAEEINKHAVQTAKLNLQAGLHIMRPKYWGWQVPIILTSALENKGLDELIEKIDYFFEFLHENDLYYKHREEQQEIWLKNAVIRGVLEKLDKHLKIPSDPRQNPLKLIQQAIDKIDL